MTTHTARRICRALNRHAHLPATRAASGGGLDVYFDGDGREVYTAEAGARSTRGYLADVCPWPYATVLTVRHRRTWTIAEVEQAMEPAR